MLILSYTHIYTCIYVIYIYSYAYLYYTSKYMHTYTYTHKYKANRATLINTSSSTLPDRAN